MATTKVIKPQAQSKMYAVLVDAILGCTEHVNEAQPNNYRVLQGNVSEADLVAAGVDIAWQLKIGAIEELGFIPV